MDFNVRIESTDTKTGLKSRQVALRHVYNKEEPFAGLKREDIVFRKFAVGGRTQIRVYIRGFEIGNLAGEKYRPLFDALDRGTLTISGIDVRLLTDGKYGLWIRGTY